MDRREPSGPEPSRRRGKTGYYQKFTGKPTAGPEPDFSSSRYDSPQGKDAGPPQGADGSTDRLHGAGPEEPGRLRFHRDGQLEGAGDPPHGGKQTGTRYTKRFAPDGEDYASRLHFEKDELPPEDKGATGAGPKPPPQEDGPTGEAHGEQAGGGSSRQQKKADRAKGRADRYSDRLQEARDDLPTRRRLRFSKERDPETMKPRRRPRIVKEVKPEGSRSRLAGAALGVGRAVDLKVHQKIHEVEHENVGTEAAHKTELTAENLAASTVRFAHRHHKAKPYRTVRKWERRAARANVDYLYQKALLENPQLASNPLSRFQQKRRIKQQYQKAAREAKRGAAAATTTAKRARDAVGTAGRAVLTFVSHHKGAVLIAVVVVLVVFFFASCVSSCSSLLSGGFGSVLGTSYGSEDVDIKGADEDYTALEKELQQEIANMESTHPGYDEYRYHVDEIGHNPYELTSYLTAKLQEYTRADVQAELRALFDAQYKLTLTETVEVRYRTETHTDADGNEYEEEVAYDYYILTVTLTNKTLPATVNVLLTDDQKTIYSATLQVKGNKPYLWDDIYTGGGDADPGPSYEIPGEALSDPAFAALMEEATKYLGYPYVWGGSSPSTSFDCSGFVCWVFTHSGVHNLPRTTATGIYNQCAIVSPSEAKPGDCIFFTGTYDSAGPVSHIGIYVGDGMMIHCGDPIKYANINTNYWQQHFYAFGRLN